MKSSSSYVRANFFPPPVSRHPFPSTRFPPPVSRQPFPAISQPFFPAIFSSLPIKPLQTELHKHCSVLVVNWSTVVEVKLLFVILRSSRSTGSLVAVVRPSSFARTLQEYIYAGILFFVRAPVVFVNIFRCQLINLSIFVVATANICNIIVGG